MRQPETIDNEPLIHPNHAVLMLRVGRDAGNKNKIRALAGNKEFNRRQRNVIRLLEQGTDLRYIPELLGHKSSKTKENYTHVRQAAVPCIQSPLDKRML